MIPNHVDLCARFIGRIGAADFFEHVIASLCTIGNYDLGEAIVYRREGSPRSISSRLQMEGRKIAPEVYFQHYYREDPVYHAALSAEQPGCFKLVDLAPDLADRPYFSDYYARTQISEEIDFLFPRFQDFAVVVWLGRHAQAAQSEPVNPGAVTAVEPLLRSAIERHVSLAGPDADATVERMSIERSITHAFDHFASTLVSEREREVLRHTLRGYSAALTGERLGISVGTVKNHRKKIHSKLEISSQAELLSLFLHALPFADRMTLDDPLAAYQRAR